MNLSFIKVDINILDDSKIKLIRKYPDGDKLIVLWIGLLCLGMKSDIPGYIYITNDIPYTSADLSKIFDIEEKTVNMGLELFKQYKMIEIIKGGIIEIINFNRHQKLDKIERAREISRLSSEKFRKKQKLLISDGHVTEDDETDKDKDKDKDIDIEEIYKYYPSKCFINGSSTGKSYKCKDKIKTLLKKHSKETILEIMKLYLEDCKKTNRWIKNFSTFLNNLPDINEFKKSTEHGIKKINCPVCSYEIPQDGLIYICPQCGFEIDDFENTEKIKKYKENYFKED